MTTLDIILIIPLIYAVYKGFKDGVILQLCGIVGIILGVWLAFRFSERVGLWLGIDELVAWYVAFVLIVVAVVILLGIVGWVIGKAFDLVGLGLLNRVGGVVLSVIKTTLILSVLLVAFNAINRHTEWVKRDQFARSALYEPISQVSDYVFPYLTKAFDAFINQEEL